MQVSTRVDIQVYSVRRSVDDNSSSDSVLTQSSQSRLLLCNETFRSTQKDIMGNIAVHYLVVVQYARVLHKPQNLFCIYLWFYFIKIDS